MNREIPVCAGLRGGAGRTRTSNQTIISCRSDEHFGAVSSKPPAQEKSDAIDSANYLDRRASAQRWVLFNSHEFGGAKHAQRWRRRAALQLKLQPICAICLKNGQVVPATDADHIVPHKGNEWAFWYGDLQSLCESCHRSVKQKEEKRGYRSDIGIDGWPTEASCQ
jgi:5-methylcytosine-specific restriction enzyme A